MKKIRFIFYLLLPLLCSGCNEENVKKAASKLEIGMTKTEFTLVTKDLKFLKEQTVVMYPNFNEDEMRGSFYNNRHYEYRNPENVIDHLTFDGNTKVLSYLIRREKIYANPTSIDYLAIFFNQKEDKVLGWAHIRESGDVETWGEKF